jgi:hypothetical protein
MNERRFVAVTGSVVLLGVSVTVAVAQVLRPMPVPHDLAGRDDCLMCHQVGAMDPVTDIPPSHTDRVNMTCLWCHGPESPLLTTDPPAIQHDLAGRDDCLMCHAPGAMEPVTDTPANHEGRENSQCLMCHRQAD